MDCRFTIHGGLLLALLAPTLGCAETDSAEALARAAEAMPVPRVEVPPADGAALMALGPTPVLEKPAAQARVLGELRVGGVVARSAKPYSSKGCESGWYVVRPRGFVCAGASVDLEPTSRQEADAPTRALPYRYGRTRTEGVPVYARMPTPAEQLAVEPDLVRHLKKSEKEEGERLGPAANDVPLDERGVATGPAVLMPDGEGIVDGRRLAGAFFTFAPSALPVLGLVALPGSDIQAASLRKGTGVAIRASFLADGGSQARRFGVLADGGLVPIDRLRAAVGSTWHGLDIEALGLPASFVHKFGTTTWHLDRGKAEQLEDDELERRTAVPMSGRFRTVNGVRFEETREGAWLRTQDLVMVVRRTALPEFATGSQKWLDVSIANQTLTAYEGSKPVYVTLVSTGRSTIGASEDTSTPQGTFRVRRKALTRRAAPKHSSLSHAPWAMEVDAGFSIVGSYWSDSFGEPEGTRDIVLAPIDAKKLFEWTEPALPAGFHELTCEDSEGTIVHVRR